MLYAHSTEGKPQMRRRGQCFCRQRCTAASLASWTLEQVWPVLARKQLCNGMHLTAFAFVPGSAALQGPHLILLEDAQSLGHLEGHELYAVTAVEFLRLGPPNGRPRTKHEVCLGGKPTPTGQLCAQSFPLTCSGNRTGLLREQHAGDGTPDLDVRADRKSVV